MTLEFRTKQGNYIKQWPYWTGEIPHKEDVVTIHYSDNQEVLSGKVLYREISGTEYDKVIVVIEIL